MIDHLDHIVLTTHNKKNCISFYIEVLGMHLESFGDNRIAFKFGTQKINIHEYGKEFLPMAKQPTPGSLDLCFISKISLANVIERLTTFGIPIEEGPIQRTGANWPILSVYVRDPDGNLIEISEPLI